MLKTKKGQVGGIQAGFYALMFMAVALVVVVIINAFGADFVQDQQDDFTANTAAHNITASGLTSLQTLSDGTEDVTDVGIITIVLGLLVALIGIFGWYGYNKMRG
jgi:hypothetical protein